MAQPTFGMAITRSTISSKARAGSFFPLKPLEPTNTTY